jgi:pimeloyl-ACP methyl ester carboxylesterase
VVGLAVTLSACGDQVPLAALPEGAAAGDLIGLTDCTYKAGDTEYAADCGTLAVAENRSDPASGFIALPLIRVRATGSEPAEPIFWLAGGPGGSNMGFKTLPGLIERHDIVMVGYRGMDGSVVMDCPEMADAIKGVGRDLLNHASAAAFGDAMRRCAQRLQAEGIDLGGYSPPDVVRDAEIARAALGYERVNLLSVSYGTRLAMMYAWMYPDSVHRSAMISVNPPGHFVWEPEVVDSQIRYDAGLCARDAACGARTDDLAQAMRRVLRDMPERWLFVPIDPGKVKFITHFLLFHRGTAAAVFDAYLAADRGDYGGLALMSVMHDFVLPSSLAWGGLGLQGLRRLRRGARSGW